MTETEKKITLPDGRGLGFACFGQADGLPVVYCHGFPASRLEARILDTAAAQLNVALIAPDRPGIGLSDFQPQRQIVDWPEDLERLVDALGIETFALLAISGGAPYALAGAHRLSERVTQLNLVSPIGPAIRPELGRHMRRFSQFGLSFARNRPALASEAFQALAPLLFRYPRLAFRIKEASEADRRVLNTDTMRSMLLSSVRESVRQGGKGIALELALLARPWGFALADVTTPIRLWHGLDDNTVPSVMSEFLARALPNATLSLLPGEGHLSTSVNHSMEIIGTIATRGDALRDDGLRTMPMSGSRRDQPRS